jgi:hypothetical protein
MAITPPHRPISPNRRTTFLHRADHLPIIGGIMKSVFLQAALWMGLAAPLVHADPDLGFTAFAGQNLAPLANRQVLQARGGLITCSTAGIRPSTRTSTSGCTPRCR